jgi:type IV secretory pathway VirB10-like protein
VNRSALTIVAVAMGTMVLAAVVFIPPGRPDSEAGRPVPPPVIAEPTFLDQQPGAGTAPTSHGEASAAVDAPVTSSAGDYGAMGLPTADDGRQSWPVPVGPSAPSAVDPDVAAYRAAVAAPLRASAAVADSSGVGSELGTATGAAGADVFHGTAVEQRWGRQRRFMQDLTGSAGGSSRAAMLEPSPGQFALQAGTMLPAVLLTEINSDLPGDVLAQVAHDVYDSRDQQALLIPKGARLIGTYDSDVSSNQRRLFVAWTRMIFPDGRSLALPGLETKDRSGAGGVTDRVEQHRKRTFGTAALLSLIGAGAQLAQPNGGYGPMGAYPSAGQVAAGAAGQQLAQVATEMLRKQMDVQPTIRIRQGMPFQVFLRTDLVFPSPYRHEPGR